MTQQNRETLLAVARGAINGLVAFVVCVAVVEAIRFAEYWVWAIFPAAFVAVGIRCSLDELTASTQEPTND